jgi:hypothetical protein
MFPGGLRTQICSRRCCCRYSEGLAWQFNVPKRVLRKSPEFKRFHSFLVFETDVVRVELIELVVFCSSSYERRVTFQDKRL